MSSKGCGLGVGLLLVMTCGCAAEVAPSDSDPEALTVSRAELRSGPWPFEDLFNPPWAVGNWKAALPALPRASVGVFKGIDGVIYGVVTNDNGYPIEVGGAFWYKCSASQSDFNDVVLPGGFRPLVNPMVIEANGGSATFKFPLCAPVATTANLGYRPHVPTGAVPFHDAFAQIGDGFNFFPYDQMRMSGSVTVARSGSLDVANHPFHDLFIRYAHPHPGHPSALVKIGIQNSATGATVQAFNDVEFPVTPATDDFDQWQVVTVKFATPSTVQNAYVRLELHSSEVVYLDAAWVY